MIFLGALAVCLLAGLVGGAMILYSVLNTNGSSQAKRDSSSPETSATSKTQPSSSTQDPVSSSSGGSSSKSSSEADVQPVDHKHSLPPELQEKVDDGLVKGKDFLYTELKKHKISNEYTGGIKSLVALTLLESGVPADDPVIQKTADEVRKLNANANATYGITCAILFLDRLGDVKDESLIRTLAMRLIGSQCGNGMWGYDCPPTAMLAPPQQDDFLAYLKKMDANDDVLAGKGYLGKGNSDEPTKIPPGIPTLPITIVIHRGWEAMTEENRGDNSNTQFGLLGLWVAKRHGVPVQPSLAFVEQHFRRTQLPDGSWGYTQSQWKASMTCAGLLGLAVGRGARAKKEEADNDKVLSKGMRFLASTVDGPGAPPRHIGTLVGADAHGDLYYLWSLERVAMVYDLQLIGGKDWYVWAAERIVAKQHGNGRWEDVHGAHVDTCFALLVLKRVNVAKDLTKNLKKLINVNDLEQGK
jgi:hypothetical protein